MIIPSSGKDCDPCSLGIRGSQLWMRQAAVSSVGFVGRIILLPANCACTFRQQGSKSSHETNGTHLGELSLGHARILYQAQNDL